MGIKIIHEPSEVVKVAEMEKGEMERSTSRDDEEDDEEEELDDRDVRTEM